MTQPKRDWTEAIKKASDEGTRCRVCRSMQMVELAHVIGREHDDEEPLRSEGWKPWQVAPDRIVPLCKDHHLEYDEHLLDLFPYLSLWEVLQAVKDCAVLQSNGFWTAAIRICGKQPVVA